MDWEHLSEILKSLGHPVRLRIVDILAQKEAHVGALAEVVGVPQATLSQQIAILRARGLVQRRRENGRAIYSLAEPRLRELLQCVKSCRQRVRADNPPPASRRTAGAGPHEALGRAPARGPAGDT